MPTRFGMRWECLSETPALVLGTDIHGALSGAIEARLGLEHSQRHWALEFLPVHPSPDGVLSFSLNWLSDGVDLVDAIRDHEYLAEGTIELHKVPYVLTGLWEQGHATMEEIAFVATSRRWRWHVITPAHHSSRGGIATSPRAPTILGGLYREWERCGGTAAPDALVAMLAAVELRPERVVLAEAPCGPRRAPSGRMVPRGTPVTGYVGTFTIELPPTADPATVQLLSTLSAWAAWSGIGSMTGHGFGAVTTTPLPGAGA